MTRTKVPYLEALCRLIPPGARVLDYGCGIGSDGLALIEAGFDVEFADFDNPSTAYLRWRLERRGLEAPVHDLDEAVPGGFDAAFAFDVIEHVPDARAFLGEMEARADLVEVNLLEEDHDQPLHHPLAVGELLRHAAERDLRLYRVLHGSSHLVAYRPDRAGPARRMANRLRVAAVRARRRAGRPSRR
jgi:SAM-dependent methyltransferase